VSEKHIKKSLVGMDCFEVRLRAGSGSAVSRGGHATKEGVESKNWDKCRVRIEDERGGVN